MEKTTDPLLVAYAKSRHASAFLALSELWRELRAQDRYAESWIVNAVIEASCFRTTPQLTDQPLRVTVEERATALAKLDALALAEEGE